MGSVTRERNNIELYSSLNVFSHYNLSTSCNLTRQEGFAPWVWKRFYRGCLRTKAAASSYCWSSPILIGAHNTASPLCLTTCWTSNCRNILGFHWLLCSWAGGIVSLLKGKVGCNRGTDATCGFSPTHERCIQT